MGNEIGRQRHSWASLALVPPAVSTLSTAALVEGGHRLVCRAGLKLHEVCTRMLAFGTWLRSRVNILPRSCSTEHIVHFFQLWVFPICYLAGDIVYVGAGVAGEAVAALPLLHDQPVPAARAEEQHRAAGICRGLPAAPAALPAGTAAGVPRVRVPPPSRGGQRGALEEPEAEAAAGRGAPDAEEDEEEALPHSEAVDVFQEGLAMVVQDPLLCDLPIQVTLEEVNSQIALEYGQAMTVRVCKMDGEVMPVVVVQNATVLDLKKAIQRFVQLRQEREGGIQHISWSYVWRTYHLTSAGEKLTEDRKRLRDYGIRNRDEVSFIKKLRQK